MKAIDILGVVIWLVLLPILGIVGYMKDIMWLFYLSGGIILLTNIIFLFTGALRCFGSILLVLSCIIGYSIAHSLWTGLMLGACITSGFLSILLVLVLCFSGVSTISSWFKGPKEN